MVEVNRMTTPANMRWKLVDRDTGAENAQIDWTFRVGDQVKLRLVNDMDSDHPMPHPFHVHGAGRFLILARDGVVEPNLVWKDTVLIRTGETVDILLDVTNPGRWMAHCHIAEHHESGMMFSFNVAPKTSVSVAGARHREGPPKQALSLYETAWRLLRLERSVRLVHDHFAGGDLRRVRKRGLELLLANPRGGDARRLVGLV